MAHGHGAIEVGPLEGRHSDGSSEFRLMIKQGAATIRLDLHAQDEAEAHEAAAQVRQLFAAISVDVVTVWRGI